MVFFPSLADRFVFLCILFSICAPLTAGYTPGSTDVSELTLLGSEMTDEILEEYKVHPNVNPHGHPNATYILSKRTEYDVDDLTQNNLTFYGMDRKEENGDYTSLRKVCQAYVGDVLCKSCTPCDRTLEVPFTVINNALKFDCSDIEENRQCSGVFREPKNAVQKGDACFVEDGDFNGQQTCFIGDRIILPTEALTRTPGGVSSLEGGLGLVASILLSLIATTGSLCLDW